MGLGHSPIVVSEGLVFYFDPINTRSYAGTGLTGYNLIDTSIVGSFLNGTLYDSANKGSVYFDGVDDYVSFSNSSGLTFSTITVCAWFKKIQGSVFKVLVDKGRDNFGAWCLCIDETANKVTFKARIAGVNQSITTAANYSSNTWTFVCGVFDGSNLSIYINGALSNTAVYSGSLGNNAVGIRIGAANDGYSFVGQIASASIYNRALSAAEVLQNYNVTKKRFSPEENFIKDNLVLHFDVGNNLSYSGTGLSVSDISGLGATGTLINGPTFSTLNGGYITCDGVDDYIEVLDNSNFDFGSNNFTIEYWFRKKAATTGYDNIWGVNKWNTGGSPSTNEWSLGIGDGGTGSGDQVSLYIESGSTSYGVVVNSYPAVNQWCQLTGVRSGSSLILYFNGASIGSSSPAGMTSSTSVNNVAGRNIRIANAALNNYYTNSDSAIVRIYSRALSSTEILQNYNASKGRYGLS